MRRMPTERRLSMSIESFIRKLSKCLAAFLFNVFLRERSRKTPEDAHLSPDCLIKSLYNGLLVRVFYCDDLNCSSRCPTFVRKSIASFYLRNAIYYLHVRLNTIYEHVFEKELWICLSSTVFAMTK